MTTATLFFLAANVLALLAVPRRWAPLPFIATACYLSIGQAVELGPLTFTALRLLIAAGCVRVVLRREALSGGMVTLDWWVLAWGIWAVISGAFHENPNDTLINRLGLAYNTFGIYFLLRIFCSSIEDVIGLSKATAILLVPVAIEMLYEAAGAPSLFYVFEGAPKPIYIREDRIRAIGPFVHPILAGTVGGVCLPLMIGILRHRPIAALSGVLACLAIVVSSASSGPIMSTVAGIAGLLMWPNRLRMQTVRRLVFLAYIALAIAMKAPVYYLIARINFVDGSTGYHRALLIESAITYFNEWWLAGTDHTRHWAPSPGFSPQHTDITNQYLSMAVMGGLPLMLLFLVVLTKAFATVGERIREQGAERHQQFVLWGLGAALFAHAITFLSVSYFDQSFVFLYLALAAIGSARLEPARLPASGSNVRVAAAMPGSRAVAPAVRPGAGAWMPPEKAVSR